MCESSVTAFAPGSKDDEKLTAYKRLRRLIGRPIRRLVGARRNGDAEPAKPVELQMVWPGARLNEPPAWTMPQGYALRTFQPGDEPGFFCLMDSAGFPGWNLHEFQLWLLKIVPDGFFFVVHQETGGLAATAMACHNPTPLHPFGATLSCVAADPAHQNKGLGYVVSAAATRRLVEARYKEIYLETHDWRLPAIKTYLKMGWAPLLFQEDMPGRWKAVCEILGWPYTPELWANGHCPPAAWADV